MNKTTRRRKRSFTWQIRRAWIYMRPEQRRHFIGGAAITVATLVIFFGLLVWSANAALREDYSDQYTAIVREGEFTLIVKGGTNVRTEPLAAIHHETAGLPAYANEHYSVHTEGVNNCIGQIADKNGTGAVFHLTHIVKVTNSWFDDCHSGDDWNGPFYGIIVSELSKEELKLLPKKAKSDEDGIVWISSKYFTLVE